MVLGGYGLLMRREAPTGRERCPSLTPAVSRSPEHPAA